MVPLGPHVNLSVLVLQGTTFELASRRQSQTGTFTRHWKSLLLTLTTVNLCCPYQRGPQGSSVTVSPGNASPCGRELVVTSSASTETTTRYLALACVVEDTGGRNAGTFARAAPCVLATITEFATSPLELAAVSRTGEGRWTAEHVQ